MAVDTPARISILGAGPIGIEAALYARFLGYEVLVFDSGDVGENLRKWGHVEMFTPLGMNSTPLGLSALTAQDENYKPPAEDKVLTGRQLLEAYLLPLAKSDLVADCLRLHHTVQSVARATKTKVEDALDSQRRSENPFVILVRDEEGHEHTFESEIVLDCTGVYGQANFIGSGGSPALGELSARQHFETGMIDIRGRDAERYANQQVLLIGAGYMAASNICLLGQLARETLETHVTWVTREPKLENSSGPVRLQPDDRLPARNRIIEEANRLAGDDDRHVVHWPETVVKSVHFEPQNEQFHVTLEGKHSGVFTYDRVVANVGFRPDLELTRELQTRFCPVEEAVPKLAEVQAGEETKTEDLAACLMQPEPNFYVLGSKSYGRDPRFLLQHGFEQIRAIFSVIGDRADLNLYAAPLKETK
ncbi:monooxygenase [bacterium]|nr:monooxygenase [bacterium]